VGAATETTANGFEVVRPLFTEPDMLYAVPAFEESALIQEVIRKIRAAVCAGSSAGLGGGSRKKILVKLNGPYSVLASLVKPEHFYRWFATYRDALHAALASLTASLQHYLDQAIDAGAAYISLADPYAEVSVLGEKRFKEFAGGYLVKLVRSAGDKEAVIHLCPHTSIPLAQFGFFEAVDIPVSGDSYLEALIYQKGPLLLGNRCIYAGKTESITRLVDTGG
jgi:uroporphyrinogen-III decarboxylase